MKQLSSIELYGLYAVVALSPHLFAFVQQYKQKKYAEKLIKIRSKKVKKSQIQSEWKRSGSIFIHAVAFAIFCEWGLFTTIDYIPQTLWTFSLGVVVLESWSYISHRLLHHPTLYVIHRPHHESVVNTPFSGMSFSLLEKCFFSFGLLFLLGLISQFVIELNVMGVFFLYLAYFYVNSIGHSNTERKKSGYPKTKLGSFFATSTYHSLHHENPNANYGLMSRFFDRWFRSEVSFYSSFFEKVVTDHKNTSSQTHCFDLQDSNSEKVTGKKAS